MDNKEKQITALDDEELVQASGGFNADFEDKDVEVRYNTILKKRQSEYASGIYVPAGTKLRVLAPLEKWYQVFAPIYNAYGFFTCEEVSITPRQ